MEDHFNETNQTDNYRHRNRKDSSERAQPDCYTLNDDSDESSYKSQHHRYSSLASEGNQQSYYTIGIKEKGHFNNNAHVAIEKDRHDQDDHVLSTEEMTRLAYVFHYYDDGSGYVKGMDLQAALTRLNIKIQAYEVREIMRLHSDNNQGINLVEFITVFAELKTDRDYGSKLTQMIQSASGLQKFGGMSTISSEGTTHSVCIARQVAFANWINRNFKDDPDCQKYLPLDPNSSDLYTHCKDGVLYCKLVNLSQPGTIDERAVGKFSKLTIYQIYENLTLALNSAQAIGCNIINIGPDDLYAGKPHLVNGFLWQVIRCGLLSPICLNSNPGLAALLGSGDSLEDLIRMSPEQILIKWVNYHLAESPCHRRVANLAEDIQDSVVYLHLLHQIAPSHTVISTAAEHEESDLLKRAECMLVEADKIECRVFILPADVVRGSRKLNLAFVAYLFNTYPALENLPPHVDLKSVQYETREEKMYRNWMNSMGVSPRVNHLYNDLRDGLIILQLYDVIKPGIVDWKEVVTHFNSRKMLMEKIENCNYVIELGKMCKFSLVGIAGNDICEGKRTLTLALVWQLMKAYTLRILSQLAGTGHRPVDREITEWANSKLQSSGKLSRLAGFNDPCITNGRVIIDLVDACQPGCIQYDLVRYGNTMQDKVSNAMFAISMARRIGAAVYALPEDIVEVKAKMVMTLIACLMIRDHRPPQYKY